MYTIARMRLANDTRAIQTKSGTRMQTAFGFIDIDSENGLPCGVVAFGTLADVLAKYGKSDTIRISGTFKANDYTNKEGEQVNGYQIVAEGIAGVKSATMKHQKADTGHKAKAGKQSYSAQNSFYDDDLSVLDNR